MDFLSVFRLALLGLVVTINVLLALLVFQNNPKAATNRVYSLLSLVITIWLIVNYISFNPNPWGSSLLWIRLSIFFAAPLSTLFFVLAHTLPSHQLRLKPQEVIAVTLTTLAVMVIAISPFAFTGIQEIDNSPRPTPGPGMIPFTLYTTAFSILSVVTLIRKFRRAQGFEKEQFRYIMIGILLMLGLIITTVSIPVIFLKSNTFVPFIPLYTLTFLGLTAYTILKHKFFDIRLVVARTVVYTLVVLAIGGIYSLALFLIGTTILNIPFSLGSVLFYGVLTLLVAFTFESFKKGVEISTDKIFFKGSYDSNQLLSTLAHIMSREVDLTDLTTKLLQTIISEMRLTKAAFVLLEANSIYQIMPIGFPPNLELTYYQIMPLIKKNTAVFEDLEEGDLKKMMRDLHLSVAKSLEVKDKTVGILLLGEKASGEIYSTQDLKIIEILAPEVAVAIQNSQSVDKIKRFNVTLTQEIQKATKDLQIANEKLKQLDQLKDDFVSIASHELRTPMTAIRSYSWMALHKPDIQLSDKMKRYLERTLLSTERLINLVNDMLNISRIESGRIEISPRPFDIQTLTQETLAEVDVKAKEKNIHLQVQQVQLPPVFADPDKVHQVLLNLVGNALKFTPQDGNIALSFFPDGQMIDVSVKDSGVGISKDDQSRLFSKFGRLDNSYVAAATSGGTGLGLYICKSLVELMHGRIWANSEGPGTGTTFTFSLPIANQQVLQNAAQYARKPQGEVKGLEPVAI